MVKTYIARHCTLCTHVIVNGINVNLEFTPYSNYHGGGSGSIFTTDNEELQQAMESDYKFNNKYHLLSIDSKDPDTWYAEHSNAEEGVAPEPTEGKSMKVVEVTSAKEAMTYLQENYDWKPKTRPTKASIVKAAESFGVVFEGI